jgi:hypothetical protein
MLRPEEATMKGNFKTKAARLKQGRGWDETNRIETNKEKIENKRHGPVETTGLKWKDGVETKRTKFTQKGRNGNNVVNWHVKEISDTKN